MGGCCLMAPMLSLDKVSQQGMNRVLLPVGSLIALLAPGLPVAETPVNTMYPEVQAHWDADPLTYTGKTRAVNAMQYLRTCGEVVRETAREVATPFLTFHSERDTYVDPDSSKLLYAKARSSDKTLRLVNHMWHILTKEPGSDDILGEITAWLHARTRVESG